MLRREFLVTSAAALAQDAPPRLLPAKAEAMILLWMAGGMAQTETLDPKKKTPYEPGIPAGRVLSTFDSIPTAVDGVRISEGLDSIARVMDKCTLVRSHRVGDLGFILHSRHQYHWHTGYAPPQALAVPHMGAWVAKSLGPRHPDVPPFLSVGQNLEIGAESDAVKAFHTAGFFGTEFGPFHVDDPREAISAVRPPKQFSELRFRNRYESYRKLMAASPVLRDGTTAEQESLLKSVDDAHRFLASPAAKAFDITLEPKASFDKYNTGKFGLGCLLARRAIEAGARFIEVSSEYIPFRYWDTHENGHSRLVEMKRAIDSPIAQLISDLDDRGLLNKTLVVMATEFGRDMVTEGKPEKTVKNQVIVPDIMTDPKHYGMHRHFTEAVSVLMAGGGIRRGALYGKTADERPCRVVQNPVSIEDLHATIYRSLGIPHDLAYTVEKRPFYATRDGKGRPVMELFS